MIIIPDTTRDVSTPSKLNSLDGTAGLGSPPTLLFNLKRGGLILENKYEYVYVVQGYYDRWEDETFADTYEEGNRDLYDYETNCIGTRFRLIKRRIKKEGLHNVRQ